MDISDHLEKSKFFISTYQFEFCDTEGEISNFGLIRKSDLLFKQYVCNGIYPVSNFMSNRWKTRDNIFAMLRFSTSERARMHMGQRKIWKVYGQDTVSDDVVRK